MSDLFGISDIAGSIIAADTAAGAQAAAKKATQEAVDLINAVGAPPDLAKQIVLEQYQKAGVLNPKLEQDINAHFQQIAGPSKQVQQAQMQALQGMTQAARGGMNAEDRVAQNNILTQQARANEAAKNSIMQNLAARGQAGGGAELAMRLQAAQSGANNASQQSDQLAANAQMRALQALQGLGNLSGSQAAQQFSQNQANAGIANEQNRFNVANQIATQQRNTASQNQAQNLNLSNAQNISNLNVQQSNAEAQRQKQAQQQMYVDAMAHAAAAANAKIGQGSQIAQFGMDQAKAQGQMIGGAGTLGQGIYNYATSGKSSDPYADQTHTTTQGPVANGDEYASAVGYYTGGEVLPQSGLNSEAEYNTGGMVRGRQVVPGDSPKNDIIPIRAEAGEYIVPKEDAPSMELIHQILKGMKAKKK